MVQILERVNLNLLPTKTSRLFFFFLIGFFCLSLVYFISRGPLRAIYSYYVDFTSIYLSSSLWLKGHNPYNHDNINRLWRNIEGSSNNPDKITVEKPAVYPISIFPIIAPLTFLNLPTAQFVWTGINCLAFLGAILALISLFKFKILEKDAILICCLALSLNPIHFGIQQGNPSVLAGSLLVISLWAADRDQAVLGGILLALSLCLKVNIAFIFIFYFILSKKYKLLLISILSITIISFIAIMPYGLNLEWWHSWRMNVKAAFSGGINDINLVNPIGYLNFDYAAIKFFHNIFIIKIISFSLLLCCMIILLKYHKNIKYEYQNLLLLSFIAVINMLLMPYQRSTNGIILILPIAFAFLLKKNQLITYGNIILISLIPFLFPLSAALGYYLGLSNYYWLMNLPWFNFIILGHRTWLLLIISIVMLTAMRFTSLVVNYDLHHNK